MTLSRKKLFIVTATSCLTFCGIALFYPSRNVTELVRMGANVSIAPLSPLVDEFYSRTGIIPWNAKVLELELAQADLTDEIVTAMPVCNVEELRISSPHLGIQTAEWMASHTNVRSVDLGVPQANNEWVAKLANLPDVVFFSVRGTAVTDEGLLPLVNWKKLQSVNVSNTKVSIRGLRILRECPSINVIHIDRNQVTQNEIIDAFSNWPIEISVIE